MAAYTIANRNFRRNVTTPRHVEREREKAAADNTRVGPRVMIITK